MRIGEVAERAGVSVKTIRYYERLGLLAAPARRDSGYRDFCDDVFDRLTFVRSAQAVGLTLGEIRSILALRDQGQVPCDHVSNLLQAKAADIDTRIAELHQLSDQLHALVKRAERMDPAGCEPNRVCHLITTP